MHGYARGLLVSSFLVTACSTQAPTDTVPPERGLDLARAAVVDLSHTYDDDTVYWPTSPSRFELKSLHRGPVAAGYWYEANLLCTPEHGGTHLDAPVHFAERAWSTDQVPTDHFIRPLIVIDIRSESAADPDYRLTRSDVDRFEREHGRIPNGSIVALMTGWSARWPDVKAYLGDDSGGDASHLHFPSFGEEAARWLVEQRGVVGIAVDTASIDYGASRDFPVHRLVGAANVIGLENLTNLERLPATGAWIAALPMKIAGGSGAPLRAVALIAR